MSSTAAKVFVVVWIATVCSLFSTVLVCAYLVDPYWIFGSALRPGFNAIKTEAGKATRTVKPIQVKWDRPENIIVGSSTAEAGFDPDLVPWRTGRGYNFAFGGGNLDETFDALRIAQSAAPLSQAVISLDFLRFHADQPQRSLVTAAEADRAWFGNSDWLLDRMRLTVGPEAIRDAVLTVAHQAPFGKGERPVTQMIGRNGMRDPAFAEVLLAGNGGHDTAFLKVVEGRITYGWFKPPCHVLRFARADGVEPGFDTLRSMVSFAYENQIDVRIVIPPTHAVILLALEQYGALDKHEEWKRTVVRIVEDEARRRSAHPFPVYDFAVVADETTEPVPGPGSADRMRTFTDPEHFRPSLGAEVMRIAFSSAPPSGGFGASLSSDNIEDHLARARQTLASFPSRGPLLKRFVSPLLAIHESWVATQEPACGQSGSRRK